MRFITPKSVDDSVLVASSVLENEAAAWNAATSYTIGNLCIYGHHVYQCLIAHTNAQPDLNCTVTPPKWQDNGVTNRWKMFDQYVNTTTLSSGNDLVVTLNAGACDTIGLFNVYGSSIVIEQKDADGNIVYTNTVNLSDKTIISDWYAYFINGFEYKSDVLIPIYIYNICTVKITISQRGATASCGIFVMGRSQDVGLAEYDATISMVDYSRISTDTWGRTSLAQGPYAKKADVKFNLINSRIDAVYKQLCKCRGIPIIWDLNNEKADDPFESLLIYGYYNDMSIVIPDPVLSYCSIQIRGLI